MTRGAAARHGRGFTLLEVLIAMSLLSVLVVLLAAALRAAGQTETRIDQRLDQADELRITQMFLRQVLSRVSVRPAAGLQGQTVQFDATADQLAWIGVLPARYGNGGRQFMRLAVESVGADSALVLRYLPWSDKPVFPDWSGAQAQVLLRGAQSISLRYLDERGNQWIAPWPKEPSRNRANVPAAVELAVTGTGWPLLVVRMAAMPASDPESSGFVVGGSNS